MAADPQAAPSEDRSASLEALLRELFASYRAFHRFARELGGDDRLVHELPNPESSESLAQLMFTAVAVLRGAGYIDAMFFARLERRFPRRRKNIRAEALRWGHPAALSTSATVSPAVDEPRRAVWIYAVVGAAVVVSLTAMVLIRGPSWWIPESPLVDPASPSSTGGTTTGASDDATSGTESTAQPPLTSGPEPPPPPVTGGPESPPPPVVKSIRTASFARAVKAVDLGPCAKLRLKGASSGELKLRVRATFAPGVQPAVVVTGTESSKVSDCVADTVALLIKKSYRGARSDGSLTAEVSVAAP